MAVFPDRIVLKNSTDDQATIEAAISTGGTDAITQGEIVLGIGNSNVKFYTKAGDGSIVSLGGTGTGATALGELTDVDLSTPATDGQVIAYNSASGNWEPVDQTGGGGGGYTDPLTTDGDIVIRSTGVTTRLGIGSEGQVLTVSSGLPVWADSTGGDGALVPLVIDSYIDSDSTSSATLTLAAPTLYTGNLLVACIAHRAGGDPLTPPTGWTLFGEYLTSLTLGQKMSVFTKIATGSEPADYTWTQATAARNCGFIVSVDGATHISSVTEGSGNATTATVNAEANVLNITAATWIYASTSGAESYSQTGDGVTQITDSPKVEARISGGYTTLAGVVTSTHESNSADNAPNHGIICIKLLKAIPEAGIGSVVEDTTPQLGGDLDTNGYYILSTAGDVSLAPATGEVVVRGGTSEGKITLNCTANTHGVSIQSPPHSDAATYTLVLPSSAGTAGQVLTSQGGAQLTWEDAGSGGGAGGSGAGIYLTESQTASGGTADFVGLGYSGILQKVSSNLDAWIVLYSSAAERTADAGRAYNTDPAPGSGVLFEAYVTAGGTVVATPGTTYLNNDTTLTEAVYAAVRDQAGAAVNASVTFSAYGLAAITAVNGGTFGSGV